MPYPMTIPQYSMPPVMMAGGGSTSQDPQRQGRYGDSMLVHMSPQEVAGLQALARNQGTSLTINPQTGYPEAFSLRSLLPMIAGLALGPAGVGLTATQAGLAAGALTTAATGSLKEGIKAGLGAYGGAGVGEGLTSAATPGTPTPGTPTPTTPTITTTGGDISNLSSYTGSQVGTDALIDGGLTSPGGQGVTAGLTTPQSTFASNASRAGEGFKNLATGQPGAYDRFIGTAANPATGAPATGLQVTGGPLRTASMIGASTLEAPKPPEEEDPGMIRPYRYEYENLSSAPVSRSGVESPRFVGRFIEEDPYSAAQGGLMSYAKGGRTVRKPISRDDPFYIFGEDMSKIAEEQFAKGGISSLGPRFLSGGGDGMSDDIPAVIGDRQPARLADGEFVIPADVVSHIGNGSSKAGAKKLYKMMADIRKDRTGKTKQAPAIKPERHMPV